MHLEENMTKSKKQFGEGPIHTIANYIFWFFLSNLYFMLLNIPLIFILIMLIPNGAVPINQWFTPIIIICLIPVGPSAVALFSVMGKLVRESDIDVTKDFFKAYKTNFFQSLIFWTIEIIIISILFTDVKFFTLNRYPQFLSISALVVITFIFLISLFAFPIMSRFYLSTKDILKLAAYYTIRKFYIAILNIASFLLIGLVFLKVSSFIALFICSIICYLIMFYEKKVLLEIQENSEKKSETIDKNGDASI